MKDYFRILAIDYGKRRIGLAISDLMRIIVKPIDFISVNDNINLIDEIKNIVNSEQVKLIILGVPEENKNNQELVEEINIFADDLRKEFDFEIILVDESFSSQKAVLAMIESGKKKKYRKEKGHTDSFAAAIILKEYLENEI